MERYEFDDDYVRRLLAGDRQTEEHFHDYFGRMTLLWLRRRVRSKEDVEDVQQATFARVLAGLPIRDGRALGSYVVTTCRNVFFEHLRNQKRADRTDAAVPEEIAGDDVITKIAQDEDAGRVRAIIDRMTGRDGRILRLYFLQELSKEEVCRQVGIDSRNFNVALCRAKKKFKELYERKSTLPFSPSMMFVTLGRLWSLRL